MQAHIQPRCDRESDRTQDQRKVSGEGVQQECVVELARGRRGDDVAARRRASLCVIVGTIVFLFGICYEPQRCCPASGRGCGQGADSTVHAVGSTREGIRHFHSPKGGREDAASVHARDSSGIDSAIGVTK